VVDRRGEQRGRRYQALVVAGLPGQVAEQVPETAVGEPDPPVLAVDAEQHLRDGQGQQLRVAESGPSPPSAASRHNVIVDLHIKCGQEGVQVVRHSRSWPPSSHFPVDRHAVSKESII
jgi:predicted kinase